MWLCPKCATPLDLQLAAPVCDAGHCYDRAKQGYLNLLLANKKNSRNPGDNEAMIDARRAFLRAGFYEPLLRAVSSILDEHLASHTEPELCLVDVGCGEGYYLESIVNALKKPVRAFGIDISKPAIRKAAMSAKHWGLSHFHYAVASNYDIPLPSGCADSVINVFAPSSEPEVHRVLKPSGYWVRVNPGPRHLYQIKDAIYDRVRLHQAPPIPANFALALQRQIDFSLAIEHETHFENLMAMTPFNWHGHSAVKQAIFSENTLNVEASFCVQLLRAQEIPA